MRDRYGDERIPMQRAASSLPIVGLGTFKSKGVQVKEAVRCALEHGIRHIDTASVYKNEEDVGAAVKEFINANALRREDIYITSKVSPYEQGQDAAAAACDAILHRLDLGYVDLMLIHWPGVAKTELASPVNAQKRLETWRVLETFHSRGLIKALGVSNYEIHHLEELLQSATVLPLVNQVECHPLWQQEELRQWCAAHGIGVVAYSPFATGAFFRDCEIAPKVAEIAQKCGKTPAQVLLCYCLQKEGCWAVLPKSTRLERIQEFSPIAQGMQQDPRTGRWLPQEVENALDALGARPEQRKKFCWDPSGVA